MLMTRELPIKAIIATCPVGFYFYNVALIVQKSKGIYYSQVKQLISAKVEAHDLFWSHLTIRHLIWVAYDN